MFQGHDVYQQFTAVYPNSGHDHGKGRDHRRLSVLSLGRIEGMGAEMLRRVLNITSKP
jgi:hypothetical protein